MQLCVLLRVQMSIEDLKKAGVFVMKVGDVFEGQNPLITTQKGTKLRRVCWITDTNKRLRRVVKFPKLRSRCCFWQSDCNLCSHDEKQSRDRSLELLREEVIRYQKMDLPWRVLPVISYLITPDSEEVQFVLPVFLTVFRVSRWRQSRTLSRAFCVTIVSPRSENG